MPTPIKTGWLNEKDGGKFAPKTLISQVQTEDGTLLEDKLQSGFDEAKTYTDTQIAEKITAALGDIEAALAAL